MSLDYDIYIYIYIYTHINIIAASLHLPPSPSSLPVAFPGALVFDLCMLFASLCSIIPLPLFATSLTVYMHASCDMCARLSVPMCVHTACSMVFLVHDSIKPAIAISVDVYGDGLERGD